MRSLLFIAALGLLATVPAKAQGASVDATGEFLAAILQGQAEQEVASVVDSAAKSERFYVKFRYYAKSDACVAGYTEAKNRALKACEDSKRYSRCQIQTWGTSAGPIRGPSDEWPYECEAYAIAVGDNPMDNPLEVGLGWGGNSCHSGAGEFGQVLGQLSIPEVGMYARCAKDEVSREYGEIVVGVVPAAGSGLYKTRPACLPSHEACENILFGPNYGKPHKPHRPWRGLSGVGSRAFNLSLVCREAERKDNCGSNDYVISGTVQIFPGFGR